VTVAHVAGFPLEEGLLQLAPAGAALLAAAAIAGRTTLDRLRRRRSGEARGPRDIPPSRKRSSRAG
jgi:hypothetical protein